MNDVYENKKIKIADNPGFKIYIELKNNSKMKPELIISINNINHIGYLEPIDKFINGLIKIECIKITNEANDAKAAKTLIWPTLETMFGMVAAPIKYPTK